MPHSAGPGTLHFGMVYFPDIDNFQRLIQFFLKKLRPPFVITQRRQRVNYLIIAEMLSEIGFHSPEGNQIINLHAVLFFHILKQRIKLTVLRLRRRRFFGINHPVEIFGRRQHKLNLPAVYLYHFRIRVVIVIFAVNLLDRLFRYAAVNHLVFKFFQPPGIDFRRFPSFRRQRLRQTKCRRQQ